MNSFVFSPVDISTLPFPGFLAFITLAILQLFSTVTLFNWFLAPLMGPLRHPARKKRWNRNAADIQKPLLSVCIPARNEAENIPLLLADLAAQSLIPHEVLVLDDHSTDGTGAAAEEFAAQLPLQIFEGTPLPQGWSGKNWACHQLFSHAKGNLILFIDADVRLAPDALQTALTIQHALGTAMLSVFPRQITESRGESLIVPMMNWLLLTFLPLRLVYTSFFKSFVAANGQFILVDSDSYTETGGHEKMKGRIVEDMEMARSMRKMKKPVLTLLGGESVSCRMYKGFHESLEGFTKNFYAGFNTSQGIFLFLLAFIFLIFLIPFLLFPVSLFFFLHLLSILGQRYTISHLSGEKPMRSPIYHPLQILLTLVVGWKSMQAARRGISWKGRMVKEIK